MTELVASSPAEWSKQFTHFGGFDWARRQHHFVAVDRNGEVVLSLSFDNTAEGWAELRREVADLPELAVAIETSCGSAVDRLLDMGLAIYPLNPKAAERYRDRKAPSGIKSDALDAWSFGDALRTDGYAWRQLRPQDPLTAELRLLCRDEMALIEQRTALVNQIQQALHEYYPAALDAFEDWTSGGAWEFVIAFPTPQALAAAGRRKWEKFLHTHKLYRPETATKRLEIFANPNPAVTNAKSLLAVTLARQLRVLQTQLDEYRSRIARLFNDHPDKDCFGSLPGAGTNLAPRLLSELGADRSRFQSPNDLQSYAGTAPVTRQSAKTWFACMRWACNKYLRATVPLWANLSRQFCAWAEAYYQHKKAQGMGHAAALRCLGQRWLKILWPMWQDGTTYHEALHTRNQVAHGSWVIKLMGSSVAAPAIVQ